MKARAGRFAARAKVNLGLEVVRRRADGYHELRTIFQEISLADDIRIRVGATRGPITVRCDEPSLPADERNLAFRAALAVRGAAAGRADRAIHIDIRKRIPAGGGLGGGSSDAAAVLAGLDRLLALGLGRPRLETLARAIGADVPFFLTGATALGTERGDRIRPLRLDIPRHLVLVPGGGGVATAAVFRGFRKTRRRISPIRRLLAAAPSRRLDALSRLVNDLEPAATSVSPRLAETRDAVRAAAARGSAVLASMSGSGSAFFVVARDRASAGRIARDIRARGFAATLVTAVGGARGARKRRDR
jgi:4-diphosphocytidyl-2-C-methyl-D-erythritol kinase